MDSILQMPGDAILFITHDVDLAVVYNRILYDGTSLTMALKMMFADEEKLSRCRILPTHIV
jgi:hypothetical protein